jgi:hypothetical protein
LRDKSVDTRARTHIHNYLYHDKVPFNKKETNQIPFGGPKPNPTNTGSKKPRNKKVRCYCRAGDMSYCKAIVLSARVAIFRRLNFVYGRHLDPSE